jgi:putative spermidine/putrescine transport system permease protein
MRSIARWLQRHRRVQLGSLLGAPLTWLVVVYLGSIGALILSSFYGLDTFTFSVVKKFQLANYRELFTWSPYGRITLRTIGVALGVTILDLALAIPIAFYMVKVASVRTRRILTIAVTLPLWASYLVKAYAWRILLDPVGGLVKKVFGGSPSLGATTVIITLAYLWLPYAILPIVAGFDRLPNSLLEASSDLGAKAGRTFRSIAVPVLLPAIIAATIFTFSLSLGDYIAVGIVGGKTQMIGNVIYSNFGVNNVPFAAAFAVAPMLIMVGYLLIVRRTGALDNL